MILKIGLVSFAYALRERKCDTCKRDVDPNDTTCQSCSDGEWNNWKPLIEKPCCDNPSKERCEQCQEVGLANPLNY